MIGGVKPLGPGVLRLSNAQASIASRVDTLANDILRGNESSIDPHGSIGHVTPAGVKDTGLGLQIDLNA